MDGDRTKMRVAIDEDTVLADAAITGPVHIDEASALNDAPTCRLCTVVRLVRSVVCGSVCSGKTIEVRIKRGIIDMVGHESRHDWK